MDKSWREHWLPYQHLLMNLQPQTYSPNLSSESQSISICLWTTSSGIPIRSKTQQIQIRTYYLPMSVKISLTANNRIYTSKQNEGYFSYITRNLEMGGCWCWFHSSVISFLAGKSQSLGLSSQSQNVLQL